MNEWGLPISKDKIIARRNRLIEYQKLGELKFTPLYETIDENILDINYMLHEIDNLQSKIDKAIEFINSQKKTISKSQADLFNEDRDNKPKLKVGTFMWNVDELLDILKEDK